jgi:hypothetical protein
MEISNGRDESVQIAVQAQTLNMMQTQGAGLVNMIASATVQRGSVNQPGQGLRIDVHA